MEFKFDPETHRGTLDGIRIPSVTELLRFDGQIDTRFMKPGHANKGRRVHAIIEYYLDRDLDEDSVSPEDRGYFDAFKCFLAESSFEPISWERVAFKVFSVEPLVAFFGIPDLVGYMGKGSPENPAIGIDIKTGQPQKWHEKQLDFYSLLDYIIIRRGGLYLKPDGKYRFKEFPGAPDHSYCENLCRKWWKEKGAT